MQITDTGAHLITWKYSNKPDRINHAIELDGGYMLFVVSAGEWGDYEWILSKEGRERSTFHGWGSAKREGEPLPSGARTCGSEGAVVP